MDCHGPLTKWWCNCRGKRTSWQGHPKKEFSKSSLFWNDVLNFSHGRFRFNMIWLIYLLCLTIFHLEWLKPENSCVRFEFLCQVFPFQAFRIEADLPEGTFHFVGRSLCQRWMASNSDLWNLFKHGLLFYPCFSGAVSCIKSHDFDWV